MECRALLDSALQGHFVTESLVQQINWRTFKAPIPVQGINEITKAIQYATLLEIKIRFSNWETKIHCAIHLKITGTIPGTYVYRIDWDIREGLMLVDGNSNRPDSIDILLGAEVFFEVLCHDKNIR